MSSRRVRISPIAVLGVGLILVLIAVAFAARGGGVDKGRTGNQRVAARDATKPEKRCTSERTYDGVKQELFRSAAQLRTSDQAAYDRLSAYSALRMERPLLRSHDKDLGTVRCSGTLFLDLPPGVAAVGGRRSLTADIDYILQPAADGSGDVVMLEGDGPITVPLATLARTGETRVAASGDLPAVVAEQGNAVVSEPPTPAPAATHKPEPVAVPPTPVRPPCDLLAPLSAPRSLTPRRASHQGLQRGRALTAVMRGRGAKWPSARIRALQRSIGRWPRNITARLRPAMRPSEET
jgi:hypothetical protein